MVRYIRQKLFFNISECNPGAKATAVNVNLSVYSIPRINCLDCLDRTNVMMARISEAFVYEVADRISKGEISR